MLRVAQGNDCTMAQPAWHAAISASYRLSGNGMEVHQLLPKANEVASSSAFVHKSLRFAVVSTCTALTCLESRGTCAHSYRASTWRSLLLPE
jgi:hypothetical protein